jgi:selenocysteine lyase/cysteine desulfurase
MHRPPARPDRREWLTKSSLAACGLLVGSAAPSGAHPAVIGPDGGPDWQAVARQFLIEEGVAYFNAGTYGPSARSVNEIEAREREAMSRDWMSYFVSHHLGPTMPKHVERIARFVGASADGIALLSGTTEAMNVVAGGLDLRAGDEIVTTTHEHQAGIYPWLLAAKRRGCVVRQIPMACPQQSHADILERFNAAITPRTRVLSFCHIHYTDGTVLPVRGLSDLARRRGILSVVDGAQTVGMIDVRIADLGCDVYATSLHKWLSAPYGTGLLWIRREVQDRIWPSVVEGFDGWDTVDRYGDTPTTPGRDFVGQWPAAMQKYAWGALYFAPLIWATLGAIDLHEQLGKTQVEPRARALARRLRVGLEAIPGIEVLTPPGPEMSAAIVAFRGARLVPRTLSSELRRDHRIIVRTVSHPHIGLDACRVCTHIWNTEEQVDLLLGVLKDKLAKASPGV